MDSVLSIFSRKETKYKLSDSRVVSKTKTPKTKTQDKVLTRVFRKSRKF